MLIVILNESRILAINLFPTIYYAKIGKLKEKFLTIRLEQRLLPHQRPVRVQPGRWIFFSIFV